MNAKQGRERGRNGARVCGGDDVGRLLGLVSPPFEAPDDVRARVKAAARREWLSVAERKPVDRRFSIGSLAAALLALAIGAFLYFGRSDRVHTVRSPATLEATTGKIMAFERAESGVWIGHELQVGEALHAGTRIETERDARAALRLAGGQSLRLDTGSRLHLIAPELVSLESGAIYLDSNAHAISQLEIRTAMAVAREIGTQFELRIVGDSLRIRVREGAVELEHPEGSDRADPGSELTLAPDGTTRHRPIALYGPEWNWSLAVSPVFELEGSDVGSFLDWVARETGWLVEYADPAVELEVAQIVLHGSLEGVPADLAPSLVLETCGIDQRLDGGRLIIDIAR